ncbi:MAG: carbon-nitrogen hydrolase family protein, partial [Deltaproteobacteria bacterium]|nr:carbon-nitrogen hydrolase family protein [Deltaproteobacteria bacterium]
MKVALVQMCSTPDLAANSAKIHRFLDEAVAGGSELVLFPENCFYIGPLALLGDAARALEESWLPALRRRVASTSGTWVLLGSVPTWEEGRLHNRQQVLDERGRTVAAYDKIHLFALPGSASSLDERRMITPGAEPRCFERGGIRWGQTICYDLRFPEL